MHLVTTVVFLVLLITDGYAFWANKPLRTSRYQHCTSNRQCTRPGERCVSFLGICDMGSEEKIEKPTASPLACFIQSSPRISLVKEDCFDGQGTGSEISRVERNKIVDFVNEYRAMINNNCTLGLGVPKPASNYRKVKYNCALEVKSKFECSSNLTPESFTSDKHTWRSWGQKQDPNYRLAIFPRRSPWANQLLINPELPTVENDGDKAVFVKLFMSEDVTQVGCYVKVCGGHEYIACRTNRPPTLSNSALLYTPGQRCNADADCTLPGYRTCDATVGLCDYMFREQRKTEALLSACQSVRNIYINRKAEQCDSNVPHFGNTIGNKERDIIVHVVNHYRKLVNNKCDLGKGNVAPITNYRKVKYSCALEKDAGNEFRCWNVNPALFKSTRYTLKYVRRARSASRTAIFAAGAPWNQDMVIDPQNQTTEASENIRSYLRFMLSPDVTEVGCFVKICGGYEYMACKNNHAVAATWKKPLYTPGNRCIFDKDCTLPGYPRCDYVSGLCDSDP